MQPLRFQIISPSPNIPRRHRGRAERRIRPPSFKNARTITPDCRRSVAQTREALEGWTPDAVNALAVANVVFLLGDHKLPFTTEAF